MVVEHLGGGLDVVAHVAALEPILRAAPPDELDQLGALTLADPPQLVTGDVIDRRPRVLIVSVSPPVGAEVTVEQLAHLGADPGGDVDAIGDMVDRYLLVRLARPQRRPHCP